MVVGRAQLATVEALGSVAVSNEMQGVRHFCSGAPRTPQSMDSVSQPSAWTALAAWQQGNRNRKSHPPTKGPVRAAQPTPLLVAQHCTLPLLVAFDHSSNTQHTVSSARTPARSLSLSLVLFSLLLES